MKPINYLRGVTQVTLSGISPKDAVNRLTSKNIRVWSAEETQNGAVLYVHTQSVRRVLEVFPDAQLTHRGMPENLRKLRQRSVLVLFAVLLLTAWWLSGQFVWDFEITGNTNVSDFEILRVLSENGLDIGTAVVTVDSEKLSNIVLHDIPELSWFAVNFTGSRGHVMVRERIPVPEVTDPNEMKNVYAEKSGTVLSAEVYDGTRYVTVGDTVQKGDLLVGGITESFTGTREEHALARIYAETGYTFSATMPNTAVETAKTGKTERKFALEVCGLRINLYADGECDFQQYGKETEIRQLMVFGTKLPVKLIETRFAQYSTSETVLSDEACESILKAELSDRLRSECGGEILRVRFDTLSENGAVTVQLTATCRERIA